MVGQLNKVHIGDLGRVVTGKTPPTSRPELFGDLHPFLTPTDLDGFARYVEPARFLSPEGCEYQNQLMLPKGAVCVVCIGATIGKVCLTARPSFTNQQINSVVVNENEHDPFFVYHLLTTLRDELKSNAGGAATPIINKTAFSEIEVSVPPLPTQRWIARILSAYDDLIENNQRRIKILESMARALYREWFVNFRFPGYEKVPRVNSPIGEIPQGWEIAPLASLVDFAKGRKPAETRPEKLPGDVKLLLIDSLNGGEAVFTTPEKLVLAEARDTIMVMDGASSCEVTIGSSGAVGSTLGRFRTTRPDVFSPHALYRFLEEKSEEFKSKNIGAAIPHANKEYILTQSIGLPTRAIASSFHTKIEPIQCLIETLKFQTQNLRRTRDLLLPRLLSGQTELRIRENHAAIH